MSRQRLGTLRVLDQVPLQVRFRNSDGSNKDISGATSLTLTIVREDTTLVSRTAVFTNTGTDGRCRYVTTSEDLTIQGEYSYWVTYINTVTSERITTAKGRFLVVDNAA